MTDDSNKIDELIAAVNNLAELQTTHLGNIADALNRIGTHLQYLGTGDKHTPGAVEHLAITIEQAVGRIIAALPDE
jgi:hypothetical protein